jgi:hypothetical protein
MAARRAKTTRQGVQDQEQAQKQISQNGRAASPSGCRNNLLSDQVLALKEKRFACTHVQLPSIRSGISWLSQSNRRSQAYTSMRMPEYLHSLPCEYIKSRARADTHMHACTPCMYAARTRAPRPLSLSLSLTHTNTHTHTHTHTKHTKHTKHNLMVHTNDDLHKCWMYARQFHTLVQSV